MRRPFPFLLIAMLVVALFGATQLVYRQSTAFAAEPVLVAQDATPTPGDLPDLATPTLEAPDIEAVALTVTAVSELLAGGESTPTPEAAVSDNEAAVVPRGGEGGEATPTPGNPPQIEDVTDTPPDDDGNTSMNGVLPITEDVRYEVGVGDTLDDIAATFDVDLTCLKAENDIAPDNSTVFIGDQLVIRVSCPPYAGLNYVPFPRAVEQGGGEGTYTVRVGDTISTIALAFNISEISLAEYNDLALGDPIFPGQVLELPPGAPEFGRVPPLDDGTLEQGGAESDIIYVVQPGDTLDVIGAFYNANPACIAESNGIPNANRIEPRTTILISEACAPYTGPNTAGGRVLPLAGEPTVAPTTVITSTPRPTTAVTAAPAATPTAEVIEEDTAAEEGTGGPLGNIVDVLSELDAAEDSGE